MIEKMLAMNGSSLKKVVNWANIMFYSLKPAQVGAPNGLTLENYKVILQFFEEYMDKKQIVMGFMPMDNADVYPGAQVAKEVIDYI